MGGGAEAGEGGEVAPVLREFVREFPGKPTTLHLDKGSFDCATDPLRRLVTPLG